MLHLPIGVSDFRELIEYKSPISGEGHLYVDKSLLIRELLDDSSKVIVLTRPRRFGKTLSLSMLQYFFASEVSGKQTTGLFDGLEISKHPECMTQQGKHPVIFISFKDAKQPNFDLCIDKIQSIVAETYREYRKELTSDKIAKDDRNFIDSILGKKADRIDLEESIKRLLRILSQYYNEKPILLIDEYDTPIQEAYVKGYYDDLTPFFRNFLSGPLKDEKILKRAILTGILRVSKESFFSGLNNVKIYSVLSKKYSNYFGFTEEEVNKLLANTKLPADAKQTKEWFNGYNFGDAMLYNPWSIIEFISEKGKLKSYWVNTSGNEMVKDLIIESSPNIKERIQSLIAGETIKEYVDEHIVFGDLSKNPASIWSLLLMSGYLKYVSYEDKGRRSLCELELPNKEIEDYYTSVIEEWLTGDRDLKWYKEFLEDIANGRAEKFEEKLQTLIDDTLSCHDVTKKSQEAFYHGLMLAFVSGLKETHELKSNKESGRGRYDISIIPKDTSKLGIVMEFKAKADKDKESLEELATLALEQIKKSNYITELQSRGIINICQMGVAFSGKYVKVVV